MSEPVLARRRIILTRPREQAEALADRLRAAGAVVFIHPAIAIAPAADRSALDAALTRLAGYDFAAFVSGNAVAYALQNVIELPPALICLAPGPGTAQALRDRGAARVLAPREQFDSEGLLALPELQAVAGRRVVIFRGDGGREQLAETLRARGAEVELVSCYRRVAPLEEMPALARRLLEDQPDAALITSSEGLDKLLASLSDAAVAALKALPIFVPHARIAAHARASGCARVITTAGADAGLYEGLEHYFREPLTHV
ncbi:uroporphyrinogen-III synthase [Burkholderiales bacterium]|nr:uroporphyrinogen-III synthase [Burkholderiales bacterium]